MIVPHSAEMKRLIEAFNLPKNTIEFDIRARRDKPVTITVRYFPEGSRFGDTVTTQFNLVEIAR